MAKQESIDVGDATKYGYRRPESPLWQCRYKLRDGSWLRATTHQASLERAVAAACLLYDAARNVVLKRRFAIKRPVTGRLPMRQAQVRQFDKDY